uniref:Kallikrein-Ginf1 n=1 Tax=Gerrhonotus infernalis TaxID=310520 RepID=E2E4H8_GERIN|nr:kallikrein-Ginf1 [Gerrhonotus infernalis]
MEPTQLLPVLLLLLPTFVSANRKRIIGGQECSETDHPWLAILTSSSGSFCSAALLNHEWVISAAHCYGSGKLEIRLGMHNYTAQRGHEQLRTGVRVICYPETNNSNTNVNCSVIKDIMLVKLNRPVDYSEYIAPIDLPNTPAPLGTDCTVMGWGSITPANMTFPVVPHCVDIQVYNNSMCDYANYWLPVTDSMLCVGVLQGGQDSCKGDSGGPLVCGGELQGIVSLGGFPCAQPLEPAIYTKVHSYLDWIQSIVQ